MKKYFAWAGVLLLVVAAAIAGWLYHSVTQLESEQITKDTWMITGLGGNVGVLRTDAGAVIVDTMSFPIQGDRIAEFAESLTGKPVAIVINTHYHRDHTHGNPAFAGAARIISTERTRELLKKRDTDFWKGETAAALPAETFADEETVPFGGKTIRLLHPGRGHTDGDLVALFVEDRVIHVGDLMFNTFYPNVDLEAGGSVEHWPATLDAVSKLEFDKVIPGHGPLTDREGLVRYRAFFADLWEKTSDAARRGLPLKETLAAVKLTADNGMATMQIPFILRLDRDFVVTRAWEEATGAVKTFDAKDGDGRSPEAAK
jgi:glyoxylase-like metal-dependent hydrolase (beta-lactamase superfamily II)